MLRKSAKKSFMSAGISSSQPSLEDNDLRTFSNFALTVPGAQSNKGLNVLAAWTSISPFVNMFFLAEVFATLMVIQNVIVFVP